MVDTIFKHIKPANQDSNLHERSPEKIRQYIPKMEIRAAGTLRSRVAVCIALACGAARLASATKFLECPADSPAVTYEWVSSGEYLYVTGEGGCVTLSDIYRDADDAPLIPMDAEGEEVETETG